MQISTAPEQDKMSLKFDDDDGSKKEEEEAPILVGLDAPQLEVIGKVPITIVTGYLGAGSMFRICENYIFGPDN